MPVKIYLIFYYKHNNFFFHTDYKRIDKRSHVNHKYNLIMSENKCTCGLNQNNIVGKRS